MNSNLVVRFAPIAGQPTVADKDRGYAVPYLGPHSRESRRLVTAGSNQGMVDIVCDRFAAGNRGEGGAVFSMSGHEVRCYTRRKEAAAAFL